MKNQILTNVYRWKICFNVRNQKKKKHTHTHTIIFVDYYLHAKLLDQRNQWYETKIAINISLDLAELIYYVPPHGKHVKVALLSATFHQLKCFPQCLFQTIQRFLRRWQAHQVRWFQLLQQVPYQPHVLR